MGADRQREDRGRALRGRVITRGSLAGECSTWQDRACRGAVAYRIIEIEPEKKIAFRWGAGGEGRLVTITLKEADRATLVEVVEEGFHEHDPQFLSHVLDNKEGWVYTLTCLKGYLEYGVTKLRAALIK